MKDILNLTYASSLTDLCEINSSFDSAILRIAYDGDNRNGSSISKEAFERSLKTIYYCPIVCNYNREDNSLGGHDMELVRGDDGSLKLVNLTQPVGVVPENTKIYWESVEEIDGTTHEYLCAEVILWKRQEAYQKIKEEGITAQSMEITVKNGKNVDGVFQIYDFEFTAFALIGVEPCYESASLEFSKQNFKQEFSEMMLELKESLNVITNTKVDDINSKNYSMEGGSKDLDKQELIKKYGIDVDALDFSIDEFTIDELEEKFKAISESERNKDDDGDNKFSLTCNVVDEITRVLSAEKIQREWGECTRYHYVDCDFDEKEVFCWDGNDWILYGFSYEFNGDNIVIDFESKKRKKFSIVDFDEGELASPFVSVFEQIEKAYSKEKNAVTEIESKYQKAQEDITSMEGELEELRQFKNETENAIAESERRTSLEKVFSNFEDLSGVEEFELFKEKCNEDCMKYELDIVEEKCYAIRGRQGVSSKFSLGTKVPKLPIESNKDNKEIEPYGGIFEEYGISTN